MKNNDQQNQQNSIVFEDLSKYSGIAKDTALLLMVFNPIMGALIGIAWEVGLRIYIEAHKDNILYQNFAEFLDFASKHQDLIKRKIQTDPTSQIGLVLFYEEAMKTRADWKKKKLQEAYLGFLNTEDTENFQLERIFNTLNLASYGAYELIRSAIESKKTGLQYNVQQSSEEDEKNSLIEYYTENQVGFASELQSLGLVFMTAASLDSQVYDITGFAKEFVKYTKEN